MKYEVLVDDVSVFKKTTKEDTFDREVIPPEYRLRPRSVPANASPEAPATYIDADTITILTDGEIISVLRPEGVETPVPVITGAGGAVAEDGTGSGG